MKFIGVHLRWMFQKWIYSFLDQKQKVPYRKLNKGKLLFNKLRSRTIQSLKRCVNMLISEQLDSRITSSGRESNHQAINSCDCPVTQSPVAPLFFFIFYITSRASGPIGALATNQGSHWPTSRTSTVVEGVTVFSQMTAGCFYKMYVLYLYELLS